MTTLVTGATGFIGRRLMQLGDLGLARHAAFDGLIAADLLDPASLQRACVGVDTVLHCAGFAHAFSSSDERMHWQVNFEGTRNLVTAAGHAGVSRFVFLSSVKAMGDPGCLCIDETFQAEPDSAYGRAKLAAEGAVLEAGERYGMHVVNLRPCMVYGRGGRGNLDRMAHAISRGLFPPLPETHNRRSLVHVEDLVNAIRLVTARPEANARTYIVASQEAPSGRQLYDAIRSTLGLPAIRWSIPASSLQVAGLIGDALGWAGRRPFPINSEAVDRLLGSAHYSSALIERELGWVARVPLHQGLKEMLEQRCPT